MQIYNTLSRKKEKFKTLEEGKIKVYICGLTVYDEMHIGHARTYVAFDSILRYLKYRGYDLTCVQNVTDVDDKIIKRAKEKGVDPKDLTEEFFAKSVEDQEKLGLLSPDHRPKVTENISEIIAAVTKLIDLEYAYEADGSVYFDISKSKGYGNLSNQSGEQLSKYIGKPNQNKKNPLDFALWKSVSEDEYGFNSPFSYGRPGWHIECTVMSQKYLGDQIDIHGGALDLIFPHHENEIAQSQALTNKQFVKYWMHTGFLQSSGEKMSKSLGNILPVSEFLKEFSKDAFRLFILQTHYRSPIDYSTKNVSDAEVALSRLKEFRKRVKYIKHGKNNEAKKLANLLKKQFIAHMDDDFNTPNALSELFDFVRKTNNLIDSGSETKDSLEYALSIFDELISLLGLNLVHTLELSPDDLKLVKTREDARTKGDWTKADEIRDVLAEKGYKLIDNKDGSTRVEIV